MIQRWINAAALMVLVLGLSACEGEKKPAPKPAPKSNGKPVIRVTKMYRTEVDPHLIDVVFEDSDSKYLVVMVLGEEREVETGVTETFVARRGHVSITATDPDGNQTVIAVQCP